MLQDISDKLAKDVADLTAQKAEHARKNETAKAIAVDALLTKKKGEKADDYLKLIKAAVKEELKNDPEGRGYDKKDGQTTCDLLNSPYDVRLADHDAIDKTTGLAIKVPNFERRMPRLGIILAGIGYAPNALTVADLAEAKAA